MLIGLLELNILSIELKMHYGYWINPNDLLFLPNEITNLKYSKWIMNDEEIKMLLVDICRLWRAVKSCGLRRRPVRLLQERAAHWTCRSRSRWRRKRVCCSGRSAAAKWWATWSSSTSNRSSAIRSAASSYFLLHSYLILFIPSAAFF